MDVFVSSEVESPNNIHITSHTGQHDHGDLAPLRMTPDRFKHLEPAGTGELHIEENEVEGWIGKIPPDEPDCVRTMRKVMDLHSFTPKSVADQRRSDLIIFDEEDPTTVTATVVGCLLIAVHVPR